MTSSLMSFLGKKLILFTEPGRQDIHFMYQTNTFYGTYGVKLTDLGMNLMLDKTSLWKGKMKFNTKLQRQKIKFAGSYMETKNFYEISMRSLVLIT